MVSLDARLEEWGARRVLAKEVSDARLSWRATSHAASASRRHIDQSAEAVTSAGRTVLGSGNLGRLYVHSGVRITLEDLQERWPSSFPASVHMRGIGFIAGLESTGVPWAIGASGRVRLDTGTDEQHPGFCDETGCVRCRVWPIPAYWRCKTRTARSW